MSESTMQNQSLPEQASACKRVPFPSKVNRTLGTHRLYFSNDKAKKALILESLEINQNLMLYDGDIIVKNSIVRGNIETKDGIVEIYDSKVYGSITQDCMDKNSREKGVLIECSGSASTVVTGDISCKNSTLRLKNKVVISGKLKTKNLILVGNHALHESTSTNLFVLKSGSSVTGAVVFENELGFPHLGTLMITDNVLFSGTCDTKHVCLIKNFDYQITQNSD